MVPASISPPSGAKGRKPGLVCIGAQKAGTSWLSVVLSEHPQIWVPPLKELHFFDYKFVQECRRWAPWHVRKGVKRARDMHLERQIGPDPDYLAYLDSILTPPMFNGTWYKRVFSRAPDDAIGLDVTPEYSCLPTEGVAFVAKFLPEAKFIYLIRHPLDRVLSQLRMNASRQKEPPRSNAAWLALADMPAVQSRGDYAANVPRWTATFEKDRLLFLPYGWIKNRPDHLLQTVEQFAGLAPHRRYRRKADRIHGPYPMSVPDVLVDLMTERMQPQIAFLRREFGAAFLEETR